jgi:hypothetical protein
MQNSSHSCPAATWAASKELAKGQFFLEEKDSIIFSMSSIK